MAMKGLETQRAPAARDVDGVDEESSDDSEGEMDRVGASLEAYSDRALLVRIEFGNKHSHTLSLGSCAARVCTLHGDPKPSG